MKFLREYGQKVGRVRNGNIPMHCGAIGVDLTSLMFGTIFFCSAAMTSVYELNPNCSTDNLTRFDSRYNTRT